MLSNQKSKLKFAHILKKYEGHLLFLIIISAFYCPNFWSEKNSDWKGSITEERVWNLELTVVAVKKNPQRIGGSINMYLNPMNRSWAVPKHKHSQPNFDWTKANSFQVKTSVTDGNEVIPKIIANPYETTPIRIRKKHNFTFPISNFQISSHQNISLCITCCEKTLFLPFSFPFHIYMF